MKRAVEFLPEAMRALQGNWGKAVAVGLVATLLTGGVAVVNTGANSANEGYLRLSGHEGWIGLMTLATAITLVALVIGGAVTMGWSKFNLKLVRNEPAKFGDLFSCFDRIGKGFCMSFLMGLFVFLWSLLLIVPGIVAYFRYALTPYILADNPQMGALEAIRESGRLMRGNKWRLFCLRLNFFGWAVLSAFTMGIGTLWLTPYIQTATAAFYEDIVRPE